VRMMHRDTPPLAVRGTADVGRELGVPAWFVERVLSEEGLRVQRIGNARAWTDADVERLRQALAARAARKAARRRAPWTPLLAPDDLAVDLAAENAHEDEAREVQS
jgi:hypothetical protein